MWAGLNRAQQAIIPLQDPLERASEELGEQADSVSSTIDQHIEELTQAATKLRRLVARLEQGLAEVSNWKACISVNCREWRVWQVVKVPSVSPPHRRVIGNPELGWRDLVGRPRLCNCWAALGEHIAKRWSDWAGNDGALGYYTPIAAQWN